MSPELNSVRKASKTCCQGNVPCQISERMFSVNIVINASLTLRLKGDICTRGAYVTCAGNGN